MIDPTSDAVTKTIDLPGTSSGIVLGKDGNIWSSCAGTPSYMVQILTATDAIGVKNEVKDINLSGGWVPSIGLCASNTDNVLDFWKDASPDPEPLRLSDLQARLHDRENRKVHFIV